MGRLLKLTTLAGGWGCFDPERAELLLPPKPLDPRALYRILGRSPRETWVLCFIAEDGRQDHVVITEIEAARVFVERGLEPPEEIRYHLVVDDITRPWLDPGAKRWQCGPESGLTASLYRTPGGLYVLEEPNRPHGPCRLRALTPSSASYWLALNDYEDDSDAILAELTESKAPPANTEASQPADPLSGETRPTVYRPESAHDGDSPRRRETQHLATPQSYDAAFASRFQQLSPAPKKAFRSWYEITKGNPYWGTVRAVYKELEDFGSELYQDALPDFTAWERSLRRARHVLGLQRNQSRRGREGVAGGSIVPQRLAG